MAEKTRYTEDELGEFKVSILNKLEKARQDYELYKNAMTGKDSNDTNDTSSKFKDVTDGGNETLSKEEAGKLAQRLQKFIQHLEASLIRIKNKSYGVCRETGALISKERLHAVPHATLSIEAKNSQR